MPVRYKRQSQVYADEQIQAETITPMLGEMTLEQANELKRIQSQADKVVAHESAHAFVGGALMLGGPVYQRTGRCRNGQTYETSGQSRIDEPSCGETLKRHCQDATG